MVESFRRGSHCLIATAAFVLGAVIGGHASGASVLHLLRASHRPVATIKAVYQAQEKSKVLVNGSGYALYMFLPDHQRRVTCNATCAASWPPFVVSPGTHPRAGSGVKKRLIGTVAFTPGHRVVSYNRWPLYTYQDDYHPGMITGQGTDLNGGYWYLVSPDGIPIVPSGDPST
jgi:predicted lipoprotein with Yx(FWY)xxD motif